MTREEAIEIIERKAPGCPTSIGAKCWADTFAALGMLKLDKPKVPEERFLTELVKMGIGINTSVIWLAADRAGLKIVEK